MSRSTANPDFLQEVLDEFMDAMETFFNVPFFQEDYDRRTLTAEQVFGALSYINGTVRQVIRIYANERLRAMKAAMWQTSAQRLAPALLREQAVRYVFWKTLVAHVYSPSETDTLPVRHHWISRCYLKNFTSDKKSSRKEMRFVRHALIPTPHRVEKIFSSKETTVTDSLFVHPSTMKRGYYPLGMEILFSYLENDFDIAMQHKNENKFTVWDEVVFYVFFASQAVRIPSAPMQAKSATRYNWDKYSGGISPKHLRRRIFHALDYFGNRVVQFQETESPLLLSPLIPTMERRFSDGTESIIYPLAQHELVIFSTREIDDIQKERLASGYNHSVFKKTLMHHASLFFDPGRRLEDYL